MIIDKGEFCLFSTHFPEKARGFAMSVDRVSYLTGSILKTSIQMIRKDICFSIQKSSHIQAYISETNKYSPE